MHERTHESAGSATATREFDCRDLAALLSGLIDDVVSPVDWRERAPAQHRGANRLGRQWQVAQAEVRHSYCCQDETDEQREAPLGSQCGDWIHVLIRSGGDGATQPQRIPGGFAHKVTGYRNSDRGRNRHRDRDREKD